MAASCISCYSVAAHLGCKKPEPGLHGNQLRYSMDAERQGHAAMARIQAGGAVPMFFPTYGLRRDLGKPLQASLQHDLLRGDLGWYLYRLGGEECWLPQISCWPSLTE